MIPQKLIQHCNERIAPYPCEGFVYGKGSASPVLMFVGEAPGETEIHNGIPFSGRAGQYFNGFLQELELTRDDVYVTSTVRSRPYKWGQPKGREKRKYNRTPNQGEIAAHAPILDAEIECLQPRMIVPMGRTAYQRLVGGAPRMAEVTGHLVTSPVLRLDDWETRSYTWAPATYPLFPIYHPAAALYKRSLEADISDHLATLKQHLMS
ncbi:uracil-DNA glycosylase [Salibacterium qingdaonense]|uniref:DNA polymerase n=1 Tax=Salibacterium qingdaonense TaxID=266892 RepID=A0A1I4I393_9BACI|nr:uracil-DNA glycosylase [Salibacterium qingdaonense]SFL48839.1 DNA polymerase [Salibacterium qingdaonense]